MKALKTHIYEKFLIDKDIKDEKVKIGSFNKSMLIKNGHIDAKFIESLLPIVATNARKVFGYNYKDITFTRLMTLTFSGGEKAVNIYNDDEDYIQVTDSNIDNFFNFLQGKDTWFNVLNWEHYDTSEHRGKNFLKIVSIQKNI